MLKKNGLRDNIEKHPIENEEGVAKEGLEKKCKKKNISLYFFLKRNRLIIHNVDILNSSEDHELKIQSKLTTE